MSLTLFVGETCLQCRKPTMQAVVEPHPSRSDVALQNYDCAACGFAKTKLLSLRPRGATPQPAAERHSEQF